MKLAEEHSHHCRTVVFLVILDVINVFISGKWCDLLRALENCYHIPGYFLWVLRDYLKSLSQLYEYHIADGSGICPRSGPLALLDSRYLMNEEHVEQSGALPSWNANDFDETFH